MGTVIGRVTLSVRNANFVGERLLLTLPWTKAMFEGDEKAFGSALVVYDQLGAGIGAHIAISEGAEAACPFSKPTPVDAYNAALIDQYSYTKQP